MNKRSSASTRLHRHGHSRGFCWHSKRWQKRLMENSRTASFSVFGEYRGNLCLLIYIARMSTGNKTDWLVTPYSAGLSAEMLQFYFFITRTTVMCILNTNAAPERTLKVLLKVWISEHHDLLKSPNTTTSKTNMTSFCFSHYYKSPLPEWEREREREYTVLKWQPSLGSSFMRY